MKFWIFSVRILEDCGNFKSYTIFYCVRQKWELGDKRLLFKVTFMCQADKG